MSAPDRCLICRHHFSWDYLICAVCHHKAFGRASSPRTPVGTLKEEGARSDEC